MKNSDVRKSLYPFMGVIGAIASISAIAQLACAEVEVLVNKKEIAEIKEIISSTTAEDLTTQRPQPTVTEITGVQLNPTETGLEIILKTQDRQLKIPSTSTSSNALTADIPNAVLNLPEGDRFEAFEPAPGIALVAVDNFPGNIVRVAVTGFEAPPTAEISSVARGLLLSVALGNEVGETPEDESLETIDILVTAEKKLETLQDVPISVTAITEQEIEDADITSLEDAARNTPNFSFFSSGNRFSSLYSIRGFSNASSLVNRDPVDFYVDGVPYNFSSFLDLDLPDLERVEILRGPQSVIYGRNAMAGVVNLITQRPTNNFEFKSNLSYGNFDNLDLRASLSGPIVEDRLFYRLSGNYESRDGYVDNDFLDEDVDGGSGGTGRGQLLWTPTENWEILINASFDDYSEGAAPYVLFEQSDPFEVELDFDGFNDLISNSQSLRVDYTHRDFQATSITSRRLSRTGYEFDADATSSDGIVRVQDNATGTIFSQELRFQSPETAERFEWLIGGYYEFNELDFTDNGIRIGAEGAAFGFPFPEDTLNLASVETDSTTLAIFGQTSYRPTEALTLTAGLRYESSSSELEDFERVLTTPGTPSATLIDLENIETDGDEVLPRFIAEYRFKPNSIAYGSITRGYRPPGVNLTPGDAQTATFEAEKSWNYELGLKTTWLDNRLQANFAAFYNPVDNFQVLTFDDQFNTTIENADVSLAGVELEIRAVPVDGLDIVAGLGFVDAEFTDYPTTDDFEGNTLTYAPDLTYGLAVQYRSPIGILGRFELQGLGTTFFEPDNVLEQEPYALVNLRLGYERENWGVYLFANNIFDTEYRNQALTLSSQGLAIFGPPATYGVQLKAEF